MTYRNTTTDSDARMKRGLEIMESKSIVEEADGSFSVPSQTSTKHKRSG